MIRRGDCLLYPEIIIGISSESGFLGLVLVVIDEMKNRRVGDKKGCWRRGPSCRISRSRVLQIPIGIPRRMHILTRLLDSKIGRSFSSSILRLHIAKLVLAGIAKVSDDDWY